MPPDSYLSMRASCDRCRFHKLKCVVNSEGNPGRHECARCIRAKVECVYSQRARAKRQKTVGSGATSQASSKEDSGPSTPSTGPPSAREEDFGDVDSSRTSSSEIRAIWSTPDSGLRPDRHAHSLSTFGGLLIVRHSTISIPVQQTYTAVCPSAGLPRSRVGLIDYPPPVHAREMAATGLWEP